MSWIRSRVEVLEPIDDLDVLEVGSYDVNGSIHNLFWGARSYVGIDIRPGPGVDVVLDACDLDGSETWDLIVSTEMLEHTPDPQAAVDGLMRACHPGSHVLLTTRSEGFQIHEHPHDYGLRFSMSDIERMFREMEILTLETDPEAPGVFYHGRMTPG